MRRPLLAAAVLLVLLTAPTTTSVAGGVTKCGTAADSSVSGNGVQSVLFQPHRKGRFLIDLSARDIELLWDVLYGGLDPNTVTTLDNFVDAIVSAPGQLPTMTDAVNVQGVYNQLRRQGSDWNALDAADSTAFRVGRPDGSGEASTRS